MKFLKNTGSDTMPDADTRYVWLTHSSLRETGQPAKWHYDPDCNVLGLSTSGVTKTRVSRARQIADRAANCCSWVSTLDSDKTRTHGSQRPYR